MTYENPFEIVENYDDDIKNGFFIRKWNESKICKGYYLNNKMNYWGIFDSDEINILTCLIARKSSKCRTIARIRNPEYAKQIAPWANISISKSFGLLSIISFICFLFSSLPRIILLAPFLCQKLHV